MENAVELQLPVHGDGHGQCLGQRHRPYLKVSVPFPSDSGSSLFFATVTAVVCTSGRLQQGHIQFIPTSGPCSLNFMTDTNHFHVLSQGPPSGYRGPVHHLFSASLLQKYGYFYQSPRVWWQKRFAFSASLMQTGQDSWYTPADDGKSFVPLKTSKSDIYRSCSSSEKHQART